MIEMIFVLIFSNIRLNMFFCQTGKKNKMFSEMKILQCIKNDVVVNLNDVIRIVHCALNIESAKPFAILTFEFTL